MHCHACGASNTSGQRFCKRCGGALPAPCPSCGLPNVPDANYCGQCGCRLPAALEERKRATLLFADIQGSTELIQGLERDPEHVKSVLAPVVRIMTTAAERYGGHVDRVPLGDAIMATFGAPQALEDHAVRACLAALSLRDGVRRWNEAQQRSGSRLEYHVRVGLSSGEIVTSDRQVDGPYGEATILASRMEGLAAPGTILLTKPTWLLARGFVNAVSLGQQIVRGMREPMEIFELEGVQARTRFNARQNQGLTQFVGREAELNLLARALRRAAAGEGQTVLVTGGPGVGKSRLIHHFLHIGVARDATVLETGAEPYDRDAVYLPIANLLRAQLDVVPSDTAAAIRDRLESRLSSRPDLVDAATALLDLPVARAAAWRELDPLQRQRRMGEAVRELILRWTHPSALVLVIEDLQWLDEDTAALVREIVEDVRSRPVLLVLSSRERPAMLDGHSLIVSLEPLEPLRSHELLEHLVGDGPDTDRLRAVVLRQADNRPTPLFLEETVSSLIERGVLTGERGHYRLAGDLDRLEQEIPPKVEEVLAVRIDRLEREQREVLQTAAVIGREAPLELLGAVTGIEIGRLLRTLGELESADLVHESLSSGQSEFRFKHTLTQEVTAARIPTAHRQKLHARTVLAIESLYHHRREEWIDRLADHASRAALPDRAYTYCTDACRRAIERSANRQAVAFFEKSLSALRNLGSDPERKRNGIDLRLLAINALLPLGEQERIAQLLQEAKELALSIGDAHRLAKVEVVLTLFLWEEGSHEEALASGAAALRLATDHRLDQVSLAARLHIGIVHHALGDFPRTLALHGAILGELTAAGLERRRFNWAAYPSVITRAFCADCCVNLGEFDRASSLLGEGQTLTREIGHPYSQAMIECVFGRYHLARGEPGEAVQLLDEACRRCWQDEVHTMVPAVVAGLATALARTGSAGDARRLLQDALDRQTYLRAGSPALFFLLMAMAEVSGTLHDGERAIENARHAERLARRHGEMAHVAQALHLVATLEAADDPAASERDYATALEIAGRLGMRPLAAQCWQGLSDVERTLGRPGADQSRTAAERLRLDLGMTRVTPPALQP